MTLATLRSAFAVVLALTAFLFAAASPAWAQTPSLIGDLNVGSVGSLPTEFVPFNDNGTPVLVFAASGDNASGSFIGRELWKTDGTTAGTELIRDINGGSSSSSPGDLVVMNNVVYFTCITGGAGRELCSSDGTFGGTGLLKDINPGSNDSQVRGLTVVGNQLFFFADNGTTGLELWVSDGTEFGTQLVQDIYPGATPLNRARSGFNISLVDRFAGTDDTFYFMANDGTTGLELWASDGTSTGTRNVEEIEPGDNGPQQLRQFTTLGNLLVFESQVGSGEREVWVSDGTADGTNPADGVVDGVNGSDPSSITVVGDEVFFFGNYETGGNFFTGLYTYAPGNGVQRVVDDIRPGGPGDASIAAFGSNRALLDVLNETTFFSETWITDGTAAGTSSLSTALPDFERVNASGIEGDMTPVQVGANLYFQAQTAADGYELWRTDGTPAGTELVQNFGAGSDDADLTDLGVLNGNQLIFGAIDATSGNELWRIEEPPAVFVANPVPDQVVFTGRTNVINLSNVFDTPPGASLTYTASSADGTIATVRVADALQQAIVEGVTEGATDITVTVDADGVVASDTFTATVVPPPPGFFVDARLGIPDEACSDPTDVSTCSNLGSFRPDTLIVDPTETVLIRYVLRNFDLRELSNAQITDSFDGVIGSAASLPSGDSLVVSRFVQAPAAIGIVNRNVDGTAESPDGQRVTRRDIIGINVPAPELSVLVRTSRAVDVCTDPTDSNTCRTTSDFLRTDTLETWARDTVLVQAAVYNTGQTDVELTDLTLEGIGSVLPADVGPLAPFDSVVVNRIIEAPSALGVTGRRGEARARDAGGNEITDTDFYGFDITGPSAIFDVRFESASEACTDVNDVSTCRVIGNPADTLAVAPGERVLFRYVLVNRASFAQTSGLGPLRSASISNTLFGPVVADTSVYVQDSLVVERLYDAPMTAGTTTLVSEGEVADAGGNTTRAGGESLVFQINDPRIRLDARNRIASEVCTDLSDPQSCRLIGSVRDTLEVGAQEPVHVRYSIINRSSLNTITEVTIEDQLYGTILQNEPVSIAPSDSLIVKRIFTAPSLSGASNALVRVDALDSGGNEATDSELTVYDVFAPRIQLNVRAARANEECSDISDISTCDPIGGPRDTLGVAAAQDVLMQYSVINRGDATIRTLDLTDPLVGAIAQDEPVSIAPNDSLIYRRIISAPTRPGFATRTVTVTGSDLGGNAADDSDRFIFDVERPRIIVDSRIDLASNACTDPGDASTCRIIGTVRDTLEAVSPGTEYLVRYVLVNRSRYAVLDDVSIVDQEQGTVVDLSTAGLGLNDSLTVSRIYTAAGTAGFSSSLVEYGGSDAGGNVSRRSDRYIVQGTGPQFRPVILVGPASIFCSDPNDFTTCSEARLKRMQANPELARKALAKNGTEREAVLYSFLNTGTESFTRHTVVDNVSGTVIADEPITVAPLDSIGFFRIYDEVAAIGDQRTVTWTAATADGDVLTNGSASEPLPVELASFGAAVAGREVTLEWITASEENNAGFEVQQFDRETESWTALTFVDGAGSTTEAKTYRYPVGELEPDVHQFRLRQVDVSGRFALSQPIEATVMIDGPYRLTDIAPHPVQDAGDLSLTVREAQSVRVDVYDLLGRRVASVLDADLTAGKQHPITLDASRLSSGVYFLRVIGETFATTQRVTVVR